MAEAAGKTDVLLAQCDPDRVPLDLKWDVDLGKGQRQEREVRRLEVKHADACCIR